MENFTESQVGGASPSGTESSHRKKIGEKIFASKEIEKTYSFKFFRKLVHVSFSLFGFGLLFFPEPWDKYVLYVLYLFTFVAFIGDTIRIYVPWVNKMTYKFLGMLFIQRDAARYSSGTYYLVGATIAAIIYPYKIAGMAIVFLGIGDFMASLGGTYLRKYIPFKLPKSNKTIIGLIFFIASTTIIGYFAHIPLLACFVASAAAGLAEVYLIAIDDNLTIPVIGGLVLYIFLGSFGF